MNYKKNRLIILIMILIVYQTFMYFIAKLTPLEVNLIGNEIDYKIPFVSEFIYAYISWYPMLLIVPYMFYKYNPESFNKYYVTTFICITLVAFIYIFYPTTMNRADIVISNISQQLVNIIYMIDTPILNCFPSMHCLISFIFIYVAIAERKFNNKIKFIIVMWSILVILSTLFVKQHVLIDVISAFVISFVIYILVCKIKYLKDFDVVNR